MSKLRTVPRKTAVFYSVLGILVVVVAVLAATSIYGTPTSSAGAAQRTATVTRGTILSSVSASGNISSASSASASFTTSGTLTSIRVQVGDKVKVGEVLATIDATQAAANLASSRAQLATARSALASAEAGGTAAQRAQNNSSLASANLQLSSARAQLAADETAVADAKKQLAAAQQLGCLATASSSSSGGSSAGSTSATQSQGSTTSSTQPTTKTTRATAAAKASSAPSAATGTASSPTPRSLTFTGTVTPGGASTKYWFQYGTRTTYGFSTAKKSAGAGTSAVTVTVTASGLQEATSYVYRLVAQNSHGTKYGAAQVATTATSACSAYQQTLATAQQTLSSQRSTVAQQEQSVAAAQANISSAVDPSTVAQDRAQVAQDAITVSNDVQALAATRLRAPISGTVTAVNGSVGDTVGSSSSNSSASSSSGGNGSSTASGGASNSSASTTSSSSSGSGVVDIENLRALDVVAGFPEADATKIRVGQPATVTLAALTNTEVQGKVVAVAPTATVVSNVVTYNVTVALTDPPSNVKVGMTADVNVYVATRANVLELPSAAITTVGNSSTVTVLENGKKVVQPVTTGLVGASQTEIVSGLQAGQVVVEPTVSVSATTGSTSTSRFPGGGFGGGGAFPGGGGLGR